MSNGTVKSKEEVLKRELGGHGFLIHLSTSRDGPNLVARLQIKDAATEKSLAKIVTVAAVDNLNLAIGVDAPEGIARDFLAQIIGVADALRDLVPSVTIEEE